MATERTSADSGLPSQQSSRGQPEDNDFPEERSFQVSPSQLSDTRTDDTDILTSYGESTTEKDSTQSKYWTREKRLIVINFSFANFCFGALYSLLGPFFPQEATTKGASSMEIGLVLGCFELMIIISTPFFGTYLTRIGAKFAYVAGVFVAGGCTVLFGFLDRSPPGGVFVGMCFAVRLVQAIGTAAYVTASLAIIANTFPDKASTLIGMLELFTGLGLMVGPPLGGFLYEPDHGGKCRSRFLLRVCFVFTLVLVSNVKHEPCVLKMDKLGGFKLPFLSSGGLMCFLAFLSTILLPPQDMPDPDRKGSMWRLFRIPLVAIMVFFMATGSMSIGFLDVALAIRFQTIYNFSPLLIGVCFLVGPGLYTLLAPVMGIITDKASNGTVLAMIAAGFAINFVAFLLMGPAPFLHLPNDLLWLLLLSQALMGIGVTTMVSAFKIVNAAVIDAGFVENLDTYGLVSGLINSFYSLGAFIGPIGGGYLIDVTSFEWASFTIGCCSAVMVLILVVYLLYTSPGRQRSLERPLHSVIDVPPGVDENTALLTDSMYST